MHYVVAAEPEPDALVTHKGYDPTLFRWSFKNEDEMGPAWGEGEEESGLESLTAVSRGSSLHPNLCALSAKRKPYTAEPVLMGRRRRNCQPHVLGRRGSSGWFDGGPISEPPSGCLSLHTPRSSLSLPAPACSVLLLPRHPPPLLPTENAQRSAFSSLLVSEALAQCSALHCKRVTQQLASHFPLDLSLSHRQCLLNAPWNLVETFSCQGDIAVMKTAIRSLGKFHRGVEEL